MGMQREGERMRGFVRHPSEFPIELSGPSQDEPARMQQTLNVSAGGLCCDSSERMPVGATVHVRIPVGHTPFESDGTVAWCLPSEHGYEVGIRFAPGAVSRSLQLVELLLRIRRYRDVVFETQGRRLSEQEAAREWLAVETLDLA